MCGTFVVNCFLSDDTDVNCSMIRVVIAVMLGKRYLWILFRGN